jgi:hypothetical protein
MMAGLTRTHKVALWVAAITAAAGIIAAFIQTSGGGTTECGNNAICGEGNNGNSINSDRKESSNP